MDVFWGLAIPFLGTTLGSAMVFFMKNKINNKIEKLLLGFASGVMIAASIWSLLIPSIDMAEEQGVIAWIPATVGFLLGIFFLLILDTIIPHYGALQGLNKDETREKYGAEQVLLWRRSTDVKPPELSIEDERYPGNDPKYNELKQDELPRTENLIDTINRVMVYWNSDIKKDLSDGKRVIIAAHGNSLRGLIKYLDNMTDEEIIKLELQTGNPICYELDDNLKPIKHYYLK